MRNEVEDRGDMVKKILRARVLIPLALLGLYGSYAVVERVRITKSQRVLDVMVKDTTLPLDLMLIRRTAPTPFAHIKDRRVIRDEAYFSTDAPASEVAAALQKFAARHGKWDDSWINWAVYDNRANNGKNRPNPPDDFRTLIWVAVDTNADFF